MKPIRLFIANPKITQWVLVGFDFANPKITHAGYWLLVIGYWLILPSHGKEISTELVKYSVGGNHGIA